jgi:iron complex transport system substrate-binding protein
MITTRRALALFTLPALLLAACGDDAADGAATTVAAVTLPATVPATEPAGPAAPATTEPEPSMEVPERIVSLSPTATEMLFAIGAGDLVIAVDDQSNFPAETDAVRTDLSGFTPNVEAIAAFDPDLVVHDGTTDLGTQLDGLGIAHWVGAAAVDFDDIYEQIEQLGAATGRIAEAAELVAQMQADIDAALASVPEFETMPSFFHELDPTLFSVTSNTFIGLVYNRFGLRNIADTAEGGTDFPQLSNEFVISQNPDLIFLADSICCGESPETVAAREGWGELSAVQNGNVTVIPDDIASRWGPRIVEFIDAVAAAVAGLSVPA